MLGETIAALRKKQGLSQQALADRLYVVRQTISKWEKNLSVPDAESLVALADALGVTVEVLLGAPQPEDSAPLEQDAIAAALSRINDQLAIQNRRRARIWKIVAWVLGAWLLFNLLVLVLGYASYSTVGDPKVQTTQEMVFEVE